MPPDVSILLNTYNQDRWIASAITSVLEQDFDNYELLVVDNGSTDSTPDIVGTFADNPRIAVRIEPDNAPVSQRFNEALARANGRYISFLYGDDRYLPDKLSTQVRALDAAGPRCGVTYSPALRENPTNGARWQLGSLRDSGDVFRAMTLGMHRAQIDMCSPLIRRECFDRHRFSEAVFAEGETIFLRLALTHDFLYIDRPFVILTEHTSNAGKAIVRNQETFSIILDEIRTDPAITPDRRMLIDRLDARFLLSYGWQGARLEAPDTWTRSCIRRAVRLRPSHALNPKSGGALCLTYVPRRARRRINAVGHAIRRPKSITSIIEDYVGLQHDDVTS